MRAAPLLLCLGLVLSSPLPCAAVAAEDAAGIQWFSMWEQAKAEAKRSQRRSC